MARLTAQQRLEKEARLRAEIGGRLDVALEAESKAGSRASGPRDRRGLSAGALSRIRMRTLLLPAFAFALMVHLGSKAGAPLGLHAGFTPGAGTSYAGPRLFELGADGVPESIEVAAGDVVGATTATGSVLALGAGRLRLEPGSRALVESLLPPRARLVAGRATAEGRMRLMTPHGILDLEDGQVQVALDEQGLVATLIEGSGTLLGPEGKRKLVAGMPLAAR